MKKEPNPRDILKALEKRTRERTIYEWRVQMHRPVEDILDMIQNRHNPDYKPKNEPYTVTANFHTLDEAKEYAYMARLKGMCCSISNNWTGDNYDE